MITSNLKVCLRYLRHLIPFVGWRIFGGPCKLTIKSFFLFLVFTSGVLVISYFSFYSTDLRRSIMELEGSEASIEIDLSQNYFEPREKVERRGFLVDTAKCRIPNLDIWNPQVRRLVRPPKPFNCTEMSLMLTYVKVETVFINESALKTVGYSFEDVHCCYKAIERIQRLQNSNPNADRSFRFSNECEPMSRITKPKFSFIQVVCKYRGDLRHPKVIYINFHMVAMFPNEEKSDIGRKLKWWQDCLSDSNSTSNSTPLCTKIREQGRPPNVLLIGWDSTSRAQFQRFMPKTKDVLQNKLGAVEMVGYNKVGGNTFPNFIALTTSYSDEELEKLCFFNQSTPLDKCPFIWKQFNDRNYLTGHVEDSPHLAIFNYLKTGFIQPPTDIYPRSLMLAAYRESLKRDKKGFFTYCIGYQRPEEVILNYLVDLANLSQSRGIPFMLSTWLTDLTHDDLNNLQTADDLLAGTLENLENAGLLENTVLLLISDHGYHFLKIRTTVTGWLEGNLPTFWIKLPPTLGKSRPSWLKALRDNSHNLVTPFDVFQVLQDILNLYWKPSPSRKKSGDDLRGISPFQKVPARSCQEAGIPSAFCSCYPPVQCELDSALIQLAANLSLSKLNSGVPSGCAHFKGAVVTACGIVSRKTEQVREKYLKTNTSGNNGTLADAETEVILVLKTKPGNFLFQVTLRYDPVDGRFSEVVDNSRVNKHETSLDCLKVPKNGVVELSCYCDTSP